MTELPEPARPDLPRPRPPREPRSNGLFADSYVPLTDVEVAVAGDLLAALFRARIAAFLTDPTDVAPEPPSPAASAPGRLRLYVASAERVDARGVVAAVVRAHDEHDGPSGPPQEDPLAGIDTEAAFAEIVADWHVDTHHAIREAERALRSEDEEWQARLRPPAAPDDGWLDEDHYVPPAPPPLPRLAVTTALGILLVVIAIVLLGFGYELGLSFQLSLFLGVTAILTALGLLVMRLRDRPDDDDDGAIL